MDERPSLAYTGATMNGDGEGGARVISLRARRSDHDVTNTVQVWSIRVDAPLPRVSATR